MRGHQMTGGMSVDEREMYDRAHAAHDAHGRAVVAARAAQVAWAASAARPADRSAVLYREMRRAEHAAGWL